MIALVSLLFAGVLVLALQIPQVTFANSLRFPVGAKITLSDIVQDVQYGSLVHPDKLLDSSNEGLIKFTFTLKNLLKVKSEKEIMIEFYKPEEQTDTNTSPVLFGNNGTPIDGIYTTKNGKTLEILDGIATVDGHMIVNKSFPLPKNYNPGDLTKETKAAYDSLLTAAKKANIPLKIDNGFRSWEIQHNLFSSYVKEDSLENALTYSAKAGHSEHQTGLAIDLLLSNSNEAKLPKNKVILDWLAENAYKYGFILRYPEGKTHITGYIFEPWHYRYVGTELAETLYNGGNWITMEEYFGVDSVYKEH